jgi:hypothetical protein
VKPAVVRFYVDADVLGLGKVIAGLRPDVTYPGDPGAAIHKRLRSACPVDTPKALDTVWIPTVASQGWLAITRDSQIKNHSAEIGAVVAHGAKLVALSGKAAVTTWTQLEIVMHQWKRFEELWALPGPFIYRATKTNLTKVA